MANYEVHPNEVEGWDVKHQGDALAISNHPTRESAIEAARILAEREGGEVEVHEREVDTVEDPKRGMGRVFLVLLALLVVVVIIVVVVSIIGAETDFGA